MLLLYLYFVALLHPVHVPHVSGHPRPHPSSGRPPGRAPSSVPGQPPRRHPCLSQREGRRLLRLDLPGLAHLCDGRLVQVDVGRVRAGGGRVVRRRGRQELLGGGPGLDCARVHFLSWELVWKIRWFLELCFRSSPIALAAGGRPSSNHADFRTHQIKRKEHFLSHSIFPFFHRGARNCHREHHRTIYVGKEKDTFLPPLPPSLTAHSFPLSCLPKLQVDHQHCQSSADPRGRRRRWGLRPASHVSPPPCVTRRRRRRRRSCCCRDLFSPPSQRGGGKEGRPQFARRED